MTSPDQITVCFHGIGEPRRDLEPGEDQYWIGHDQFLRLLDGISTWPRTRITFDDGNASDHEAGLPALRERNLTATFFLVAKRLDTPGSLTTQEAADLSRAGMTIGTHGMLHRSWRHLDAQERQQEFVEARALLAEATETVVDEAACPLGEYDHQVLTELRRLGYTHVYTSDQAPHRRQDWLRPRFSVRRTDTPENLRSRVERELAPHRRLRNQLVAQVKRHR